MNSILKAVVNLIREQYVQFEEEFREIDGLSDQEYLNAESFKDYLISKLLNIKSND